MCSNSDYISGLELARVTHPLESNGLESLASSNEAADAGYLVYKGLQSFAAGLSVQGREDVLNSLLLAQRAATKAFPNEDNIFEWYKKYFEVLENVGWVWEGNDFSIFESGKTKFEVDKAILEILGAAVTGTQLAILIKTLEAVKNMADGDNRITFFERNTHTLHKGSFQLGVANEERGVVSLTANAFVLTTRTTITKILFFTSVKKDADLKYCLAKATLNAGVYDGYREQIKAKLSDKADYIADLEI